MPLNKMCTKNSDPYNAWLNLYNKDAEGIWYKHHPNLRNAALLLKILDDEFKKIHDNAEEELKFWENKYAENDKPLNKNDLIQDKENISCNNSDIDNSDLFLSTPPPSELNLLNTSDDEMTVIASPENTCNNKIRTSPKLNRSSKLIKFKKLKKSNHVNYSSLTINKVTPTTVRKSQTLDVVDTTIIETTPEIGISKSLGDTGKVLKKGKSRKQLDNATFFNRKTDEDDSDVTYCPDAEQMTTSIDIEKQEKKKIVFKEPTVRGNARLQLEGWDCTECGAFYDKLDMNTQETKKMLNKCSKHRSKFKPQNFTPKEFWNLDFPPTQCQKNHQI